LARGPCTYLWSGNKDTLYRIHGTNEPWTISTNVSSGCIRLTNEDVVDLYNRTPIGAKVVVFGTDTPLRNKAASSTGGGRDFAKSQHSSPTLATERFSPIP
jgi:L,D-transpeptidase catalytic domain